MIWQVPRPAHDETKSYIKGRLLAFIMVLGAGLIVVLAVGANLIITVFGSVIGLEALQIGATIILYLALATLCLALLYKYLPNIEISWHDVLPGSALTALVMMIATYLYGLYLRTREIGSALDAAGTMAVFLLFFFFMAQIFVLGAVCTRVYASLFGSKTVPESDTGSRVDPVKS
jgi:membrane protein